LKGNNPLLDNNNNNNLLLPSINIFRLGERFNLSLNNNNNLPLKGLDLNVVVLVNALTGMNLIGEYFPREKSFIKFIEFARTEIENPNE